MFFFSQTRTNLKLNGRGCVLRTARAALLRDVTTPGEGASHPSLLLSGMFFQNKRTASQKVSSPVREMVLNNRIRV